MSAAVEGLPSVETLRARLVDRNAPLLSRMRTLFSLRNVPGKDSIDALAAALDDPSALLKHEIAYAMGQMQDTYAIPILTRVLSDTEEDAMVRHEAAEALGAIGDPQCLELLRKHADNDCREVRETCELSLDRIAWKKAAGEGAEDLTEKRFRSVDPAPPVELEGLSEEEKVTKLRAILMDQSERLFQRYRAMFALRDLNTDASALAIADALFDPSALLCHEVAFVLGQMQRPCTEEALAKALSDPSLNKMVRHEAAEALGSVSPSPTAISLLRQYLAEEKDDVVRDSCAIALDIADYVQSGDFQYADVKA
eukprot:CAMPEP_0113872788 /NCGR_PEP_ID=MMETSP0780_2-20120614/3409_1 /TAXON_ID=652834 /ORGANISM="Palpitomonas bilix" /LENGTH=310 /DNA_ID=CAMNT_0000858361 /DNA_START=181 /DNA_END=1113 /DNA_ORIENTATION=- /assembly_acc=CAM_ASM_000599